VAACPVVNSKDVALAQETKDLVMSQLHMQMHEAIFQTLKVGGWIWVLTTECTFTQAQVIDLKYYEKMWECGTVTWRKDTIQTVHFFPYRTPLSFHQVVFLPLQIRDLNPEQTQQLFLDVATTLNEPLRFI